jgi:hypothetical protein
MTGIVQGLLAAYSAVSSAVSDAYFNLVTLLLPGDGTNGAHNNTFLDSSSNNFSITRNPSTGPNAPTQGTFTPFSQTGWSVFLDGVADYVDGSVTMLGGASVSTFTIDGWIYPTTFANTIYVIGDMQAAVGGLNYISVNVTTGGAAQLYWFDGASKTCTSTGTLNLNQWNYFAISVSSNAITIYVNSATAGQTGTTTLTNRTGTVNFSVGAANGSFTPNAYLSNLRVSTIARTISVPTTPFTNDSDTRLLLFQSNRFINNGSTSSTLTPFGNSSVQAFSPFAPTAAYSAATVGGSGYFDGTGDYLTTPSNAAFGFGTSDFTVEAWVYITTASSLVGIWQNASDNCNVQRNASGNLEAWDGATRASSTPVSSNTWHHIAFTRVGSSVNVFLNGVSALSWTASVNYATTSWVFGYTGNGTNTMTGYIAGARILKGTGYSSITVPTAPPTAITNTSLLLNFTNAGITDATAKNDLETVGNAQISTAQSQFGGSSMSFDGTNGTYLSVKGSSAVVPLGSGDFTIEFWIYFNTGAVASRILMDYRPLGTEGLYPTLFTDASSQLTYYTNSANRIVGGTLSATSWTHIALCRASGSTRLFINGTQSGSTYTDANNYLSATDRPFVGMSSRTANDGMFSGYIDDLRITRFARYTSNFTAPTAAFPLQ